MKKILSTLFLCFVWLYANDSNTTFFDDVADSIYKTFNFEDIDDKEAKKYMKKWGGEEFALSPYRANYILPLGWTDFNYKEWTPTDGDYSHFETEIQISFKLNIYDNLFGYGEHYYLAYSQRSFWQLYIPSSPFREHNFNPELFVVFPVGSNMLYGLKNIEYGYAHISNGQGNIKKTNNSDAYPNLKNRSRSINYIYAKFVWQKSAMIYNLKVWIPFWWKKALSDNPDIIDYWGFMSFKTMYFYKKHLFTFKIRGNPVKLKAGSEFTYSYPVSHVKGVYYYFKMFKGYGESLIDYNNNITKYSFGFSFSR